MARRAAYMYGAALDRGPQGQVGCGLGQVGSTGEVALIVPTVDIRETGETTHHRRCRDRVPDGTRHRGPRRDALLLPAAPRAVHGRERHPQSAQPTDAARRAGSRSTRMGGLPDRGHRPLRRPHRRRVRLAPLADLGPRPHRRIPFPATGYVRLSARPDAAPAEPGLHRHRDRRELPDAARPAQGVAHPRLLRLGQPQRQGRLPALHGLVRRQPRPVVGASA